MFTIRRMASYNWIFQEGSMGLQIDHDCNVEEIDDGEQASKCPDLQVGDRVIAVNDQPVPEPKDLDQLRTLIGAAGRPMTLTFSKPIKEEKLTALSKNFAAAVNVEEATDEEEDVTLLVQKVSKARREMNTLRETLDASESAGSNDRTVKQIKNLLNKKEELLQTLEARLDAAGYEKDEQEDTDNNNNNQKAEQNPLKVNEKEEQNPLKVNVKMPDEEDDEAEKKKKKKKRTKSSFRRFTTIIGRAFKKKPETDSTKDDNNAAATTADMDSKKEDEQKEDNDANKEDDEDTDNIAKEQITMKKKVKLMRQKRDLQFELINSRDDAEKQQLQTEMNAIDARLLALDTNASPTVLSTLDNVDTVDEKEENDTMVQGENIMERGPMDPSSSMRWEEEKAGLDTILETSERGMGATPSPTPPTKKNTNNTNNTRSFGDITNSIFDPTEFRALEDDIYNLYEQQYLMNGRQSSMSMISTDDQRGRDQQAIRSTIKYYGKPLLVLFRAYANSAGINRIGNCASFETHSKLTKQINIASFMMMCTDFGLCTTRKDSNMNGRSGGGWIEPTIIDWISMEIQNSSKKSKYKNGKARRDNGSLL